ncbi:Polyphosphoinositide phosphatase [Durusdinium trenchii]|uniref:Polyphosphoinositide phosphatase n=1 Tax=Durusdinium trenchii TaxID=1381693 RepID=A0ABP0HPI1_9DINO
MGASLFNHRDRAKSSRVENSLGLAEFGDAWTEFYSSINGLPVARGYDRIVYGDHGPYVEFSSHQLCWSTFPVFVEKPEMSFFDEYYTLEGSTMLYAQKRTVVNKPNPPCGPWSAQNNRPEGYANYLIGKFYLACEPNVITISRPSSKKKRRGKPKECNDEDGHVLESTEVDAPEEEFCEEGQAFEGHWAGEPWTQEASWMQPSPWLQEEWTQTACQEDLQGAWTDGDWWGAWPMAGEVFPEAEQADCTHYGQYSYCQPNAENDWQETYAGSSCAVSDGESSEKALREA